MPFMKNGKRDYKRDVEWQKEQAGYREDNLKRKKARYEMEKEGKVSKGDGKHVDHKKPLTNGGSNSKSNLQVVSAKENLKKEALRKKKGK